MECKNIECNKETIGKRVYCSLTCRNIFVNKYLRNYDKVSDNYKQKKKEKEDEYLNNPKKCIHCKIDIPYDKRDNDYCNHSCSASNLNGNRDYTWGDKIKKSVHSYLISNGIKKDGHIGKYEITCKECDIKFERKRNDIRYCSPECGKKHRRKGVDEYLSYRIDTNFKFNLSDYSDEFDFSLIEKYGWYSPSNKNNNLDGVSRDHMLSVREGFELGISPSIISHPANCRLMKHTDNISKNKKSIINYSELLERIEKFENKYGKYHKK
jgi:hypothetical protein